MKKSDIRNIVTSQVMSEYNHQAYLKWKRKNVTMRGVKEAGEENGAGAMLGRGLYTAALSNKSMAREYGEVHFVVGAIPKNPLVFNTLNDWEIWFYNKLVYAYSKAKGKDFPDRRDFSANTTIEAEIQKMGYDGVIIKGREMVNYAPGDNILYFKNENQLKNYYEFISEKLLETADSPEYLYSSVTNLMNDLEKKYSVDLYIHYSKFSDTIIISRIVVDKKNRGQGIGSKVMNEICDFADKNNLRIALTPSSDFGGSKTRLIPFYKSFGFKNYKGYEFRESMVRLPNL